MLEARACRICLATDRRLLPFEPSSEGAKNIYSFYERLTGIKSWWCLPYACVICWRLLERARQLYDMSLRSEEIINNILRQNGEINQDSIQSVDWLSREVNFQLQVQRNEYIVELVHDEQKELVNDDDTKPIVAELDADSVWLLESVKPEHSWSPGSDSEDDAPVASLKRRLQGQTEDIIKVKTRKKRKKTKEKPPKKKSKSFDSAPYEEFCKVIFMTKEEAIQEIRKRTESSNYRMSAFRCDKCYRGFWQQQSYDNHMLKHDPKVGEYECDVCRLRFESRRSLQHHMGNFHRTKFICNKCPHYCTNPPLARRHEDWHQGRTYTCEHCNMNFKRVSTLRSHVRRLHAPALLCELCGLGFVSRRGVVAHKNRMHRRQKEVTMSGPHCARCETTFATEEAYKRHLVVSAKHVGETSNGCIACGETFNTAQQLRQHQRSHAREDAASWPIECEQCKVRIGSSHEYKSHLQKVHPGVNHAHLERASCMCETCGRVFKNQSLLGYHQRKHNGVKPYECATCGKKFYGASQLAMHARMHSGDMPYQCDLCNKKFNYKANLRRHLDIHSGIKPYKCDYCGKCFTLKGDRKSHVDYVHLKKPWPKRNRATRRKMY